MYTDIALLSTGIEVSLLSALEILMPRHSGVKICGENVMVDTVVCGSVDLVDVMLCRRDS